MNEAKLSKSFYQRSDVPQIARELLGKKLCTHINNQYTSGIIVETEAYCAPEDPASHAFQNRFTKRTKPFFDAGGISYVYLIYGLYKLFNVVTNVENVPHAILIRGLEPIDGVDVMLERRKLTSIKRNLTGGPGLLSMALGIEMMHNQEPLNGDLIWIEDGPTLASNEICASPRVGLGKNVFEPYYSIPWRFRIKNNPFTSPAK